MSRQEAISDGITLITKSRPMANHIMRYLHDNDVVIRVERDLPRLGVTSNSTAKEVPGYSKGYCDCLEQMLRAGCGFFELLISKE